MKRIVRLAAICGAVALPLTLVGCSAPGSDSSGSKQESQAQDQDSKTLITAQPVPHFDWSQIRQTLIDVEGAEASTVQTTSFFFAQGMDHPYRICNSIGFPVASTSQLTNPVRAEEHGQYGDGTIAVGQMDPTGQYTGQSSGTFVICVNPEGKGEVVYAEPNVHTEGGPAAWDTATKMIVDTGSPTVLAQIGKK